MVVELCDVCVGVIRQGETSGIYPTFEEGKPYPGKVTLCNKCSLELSEHIMSLIDLPDEVTLPLKTKVVKEDD